MDRNMMLTPDEYMSLMALLRGNATNDSSSMPSMVEEAPKPKRRSRAARSQDKKLSSAFKEANARYRRNDGSLRAGRTQADIARLAHRLRKKM